MTVHSVSRRVATGDRRSVKVDTPERILHVSSKIYAGYIRLLG